MNNKTFKDLFYFLETPNHSVVLRREYVRELFHLLDSAEYVLREIYDEATLTNTFGLTDEDSLYSALSDLLDQLKDLREKHPKEVCV